MSYDTYPLEGALSDPCPVCDMKPVTGMNNQGLGAEPHEGAVTICFGCGLVQVIHDGMRVAPSKDYAEWLYMQPDFLRSVLAVSQMRALNPGRTKEIIEEQRK